MARKPLKSLGQFDLVELDVMEVPEIIEENQISENDDEVVLDLRGEGEYFGMLSLISEDRSRNSVDTIEDTICYQVPKSTVLGVLQNNPEVNDYFLKSFFINLLDKTYEETRKIYTGGTAGEQLLFNTKVKEILRSEPKTIAPDISIQQAAIGRMLSIEYRSLHV